MATFLDFDNKVVNITAVTLPLLTKIKVFLDGVLFSSVSRLDPVDIATLTAFLKAEVKPIADEVGGDWEALLDAGAVIWRVRDAVTNLVIAEYDLFQTASIPLTAIPEIAKRVRRP